MQDPNLEDFWAFILEASLLEMGPMGCLNMWSTTGHTMPSSLDRFLCLREFAVHFPLSDVWSFLRLLSNHTPILWAANKRQRWSTYFKVDRSWLSKVEFKEAVEQMSPADDSQGSEAKGAGKIEDYGGTSWCFGRISRRRESKRRKEALSRIKQFDDLEDRTTLDEEELRECKGYRNVVEGEDHKMERD